MKTTTRWLLACVGGIGLTLTAPVLLAQSDNPPPPAGEPAPDAKPQDDAGRREAARKLINERIKRIEAQQKALHESLEMLDRGEPIEAVREHARGPLGERVERFREGRQGFGPQDERGPGPGPGGRGGPPPREGPGFERPRRGPGLGEGPDDMGGPDGPDARGGPEGRGGPGREERFGGRRGDRDADGERKPLSPEERQMIVDMLQAQRPGLGERLKKLHDEKPDEFDQVIERSAPHFLRMIEEKRRDPEMFELRRAMFDADAEARRLGREARKGDHAAGSPAVENLKSALNKQFDARLKLEDHMLVKAREQLEKAQDRRKKLEESRGDMIEKGLKDLLEREVDDRDGPGPGGPPPPPPDRP